MLSLLRAAKPVAATLERIGRKPDLLGAAAGEKRLPVEPDPGSVSLRQRADKALRPTLPAFQAAKQGHRLRLWRRGLDRFLQTEGQHRVGTNLDQGLLAPFEQHPHHGLKSHRVARISVPVLGVELGCIEYLAGY